jgi:hypothetical protein
MKLFALFFIQQIRKVQTIIRSKASEKNKEHIEMRERRTLFKTWVFLKMVFLSCACETQQIKSWNCGHDAPLTTSYQTKY